MAATTHLRKTDKLFACYGAARRDTAVLKQRLSNWVVEVITMAYKKALPGSVLVIPLGLCRHPGLLLERSLWQESVRLLPGLLPVPLPGFTSSTLLPCILSVQQFFGRSFEIIRVSAIPHDCWYESSISA